MIHSWNSNLLFGTFPYTDLYPAVCSRTCVTCSSISSQPWCQTSAFCCTEIFLPRTDRYATGQYMCGLCAILILFFFPGSIHRRKTGALTLGSGNPILFQTLCAFHAARKKSSVLLELSSGYILPRASILFFANVVVELCAPTFAALTAL